MLKYIDFTEHIPNQDAAFGATKVDGQDGYCKYGYAEVKNGLSSSQNGFGVAFRTHKPHLAGLCLQMLLLHLAAGMISYTAAETFILGYLTADKTEQFVKNKQARIISGAMTWAVDTINQNSSILADHNLTFIWSNTGADQLVGTRELTYQWRSGAIAFFGPEDSCDVESRVAAAWNLPMISYVSDYFYIHIV